MLQTDEVDDDYFTPIASTSLANIFGNVAQSKEGTDNEKLKYTPPKPQSIQKQPVQEKTTECLFACAVTGHEWSNNVYTSRGKLGFAIIRIQKSGDHNLILYDSTKNTLSCTVISPQLEISIKNNSYMSYYDNLRKYWSVYTAEEDTKKIIDVLKKLNVIIKLPMYTKEEVGPPEPSEVEQVVSVPSETNLESDTDSSVNKRTKASILNHMANMGHSVLPLSTSIPHRSSDSSDTNETDSHTKIIRHKPQKNIIAKRNIEHKVQTDHSMGSYHKNNTPTTVESTDNTVLRTSVSRQLVPTTNANFLSGFNINSSNEMGILMSEQRISNSELRMNMSRITDKVDVILDKVNNFPHKGDNIQTEILMKLLSEYENKIKVYEELLKTNNVDPIKARISNKENETDILKERIQSLEQENKNKSHEILTLKNEIQVLKKENDLEKVNQSNNEDVLLKNISDLENSLAVKNEELAVVTKKLDSSPNIGISNTDMENKLKNIMNDTFQTISVNFEKDEVYTGETVKKVIATVIKKITIQSLSK